MIAPGKLLCSFQQGLSARQWAPKEALGSMIWIHGLGESGRCFQHLPQAPRLASWRHWIPDLRGYGKSPWPHRPLNLSDHAEQLIQWLAHRALQPPVLLIGHSMGGVIGELILRQEPGLAAGFVNIEGNISAADCTTSRDVTELSDAALASDGLAGILEQLYQAGIQDLAKRGYFASLSMCDLATLRLNSQELVELSTAESLAAPLADLDLPVLYLLGDPGGAGQRTRQLLDLAGVQWRAIGGAGHWPFIDQPQIFVDLLADFADRFIDSKRGSA